MKQVSKTILTTIATIAALNAGQQAVQAEELSKADSQKTEVDQVQKEVTQADVTASQATQLLVGSQSTVQPVQVNYSAHFEKTLPSTGEKGSILSAIGSLFLIGFSFVGYKRKEVK